MEDTLFQIPILFLLIRRQHLVDPVEAAAAMIPDIGLDLGQQLADPVNLCRIGLLLDIAVIQAPLAADEGEILLHFLHSSLQRALEGADIGLRDLGNAAELHIGNVKMHIQYHIGIFRVLHKIRPAFRAESIVDHKIPSLCQMGHHAAVSIQVELPQKRHFDRRRALHQLRVLGLVGLGNPHLFPGNISCQRIGNGFVDGLNAPKGLSVAIAHCQFFQKLQNKLYFIWHGGPFANAANAAVIKAVLAAGHGVQVDKNLQSPLFCPMEGIIQIFDAADVGRAITEDGERDGNSHRVVTVLRQERKVVLGNILFPVPYDSLPIVGKVLAR